MTRRLVVDIPQLVCIGGCGAAADGVVSYVDVCQGSGPPRVHLLPPVGWVQLQVERPPERQPARTFAICASCYQRGSEHGAVSTTAAIEVTPS
jgi:hypothetical protein